MKKSPKQNWESNIRRTPIILGLSAALCMPSAFSYANASDPVAGELVQSVQQGRTVTGKIIDDTGEPLIGVSVLVKGTTVGTITDFDGNYSLEVPSGKHILVISYIGYKTQDITVGKSNQLNIKMEADTQALDEVVVVGYGVMKKRDVTGAVSSMKNYNPQIQISAESETKRSIFREKDKTKRSKKESAQHSKSRNKSFVMTSVSAL